MDYTIDVAEGNAYIILTVRGLIDNKLALHIALEVNNFGREAGISRYLADVTEARNVECAIEQYHLIYTDLHQTKGINKRAKVAVVTVPGDRSYRFFETAARNSGLNVTLFTDMEKAKQFLLD